MNRDAYPDFGRLPMPGTHHAPQIEMVQAYNFIQPGNDSDSDGLVLPILWNKYGDELDPPYIELGTAGDVRAVFDPFHILCAGKGDKFWVIRDVYRKVWMPLHPYGLHRHATLGADLPSGGSAADSEINLYNPSGTQSGGWTDTIHRAHDVGDTIPNGRNVPVFYVPGEQKWYTNVSYFT